MDFDSDDLGAKIKDASDTENGGFKGIASPSSDEKIGK